MVSIEIVGDTAEDVVNVANGIFGSRDPKDARQVAKMMKKYATYGLSSAETTSSSTSDKEEQ